MQDCLGVTICLGQTLPDGPKWTKDKVELMFNAANEEVDWLFHANNARFSKIASAVVSYEFKASIVKVCSI